MDSPTFDLCRRDDAARCEPPLGGAVARPTQFLCLPASGNSGDLDAARFNPGYRWLPLPLRMSGLHARMRQLPAIEAPTSVGCDEAVFPHQGETLQAAELALRRQQQ